MAEAAAFSAGEGQSAFCSPCGRPVDTDAGEVEADIDLLIADDFHIQLLADVFIITMQAADGHLIISFWDIDR